MGDLGSIPGLGRSPGEGKGYPLQYSGLENSMDGIVHYLIDIPPMMEVTELKWASLIAQLLKNPSAMQETPVRFLGREDPLEKG